ncbi:hypothetical protein K439DRAFT_1644311 [Ramaria rubella]|nr:hypothetical protein K439DRAFT_1644311 [Ramaria rubella]
MERLFELTKANVSQIGYKQRTHISKVLKSRSKAIQRALALYNTAAPTPDPPWPKLTWAQIVEYTTIAEFKLNREATICHLKMVRAKEESTCLNIEIKRLATWLVDEQKELEQAVERSSYADECGQINTNLQVSLNHVYSLRGYTGELGIGVHDGVGHQEIV